MATRKHKRADTASTEVRIKGAFRLNITEDGEIVGDTGWLENTVCTTGFTSYLAAGVMGAAGSSKITHIAIGTSTTAINASTTSLPGEVGGSTNRATIGANSSTSAADSSHGAAVMSGTFASNVAITGAGSTIANIGLFGSSGGSSMFAGNTYASSPVASNQAINVTYTVSFS